MTFGHEYEIGSAGADLGHPADERPRGKGGPRTAATARATAAAGHPANPNALRVILDTKEHGLEVWLLLCWP